MINILMSGGSGFVGQNLTGYFSSERFKIYPLERSNSRAENRFKWNNLNVESLNSINTVIHLAGKAHDQKKTTDPDVYFQVNTELTKNLFDFFLQSAAKDFIYFSSVKAVADTVYGVLYEDVEPAPQTPYGQSKQQAEKYLLAQNLPAGKRLFILRPCMIHGPGNKGNLNLLYKFVKKGIVYPFSAYENERSFLSINNLNYIISQLIDDPSIPGGIYNLADDIPLSTTKVINIIGQLNGIKPRIWKVNPHLIDFLAKAGDRLHMPLNSERLKKLTENYVVSNNKIKNALNITQLPMSSEEGIKLTIQSFHSS